MLWSALFSAPDPATFPMVIGISMLVMYLQIEIKKGLTEKDCEINIVQKNENSHIYILSLALLALKLSK